MDRILTTIGFKSRFKRKQIIDKMKNYSEIVKEVNFEKKTKEVKSVQEVKLLADTSKRDKMLEFAKRIPVPKRKQDRSGIIQNSKLDSVQQKSELFPKQIEFLENQHQIYQQKLKELKIN